MLSAREGRVYRGIAQRHLLTDTHGLLRRKVCDNPSNPELARFNDGGTDRDGRFMPVPSGGQGITTARC